MILLTTIIRKLRLSFRWKNTTFLLVFEIMLVAFALHVVGFYMWERPAQPELTIFDSVWVSFITMTTIGYGDLSASTVPGRMATMIFSIITLGCFATVASELITKLTDIHEDRVKGLRRLHLRDHILIVDWNKNLSKITTIIENLRDDPDTSGSPIAILSEAFEELPDTLTNTFHNLYFCHGSPTDQTTYQQASVAQAHTAIILTSGTESSADAVTAAAVGVIEGLNPGVETVAECLDRRNEGLFRMNGCNRIVYTGEIIPLVMTKTAIDKGIGPTIFEMLDVRTGCTLYSVQDARLEGYTFSQIAKCLVDMEEQVILQGVMRGRRIILTPPNDFPIEDGDGLILLGDRKYEWSDPKQGLKQKLLVRLTVPNDDKDGGG